MDCPARPIAHRAVDKAECHQHCDGRRRLLTVLHYVRRRRQLLYPPSERSERRRYCDA